MRKKRGGKVLLGARGESQREYGNDEVVMLSLNDMMLDMLPSDVPAANKGVTVEAEPAYSSCQPRRQATRADLHLDRLQAYQ